MIPGVQGGRRLPALRTPHPAQEPGQPEEGKMGGEGWTSLEQDLETDQWVLRELLSQ